MENQWEAVLNVPTAGRKKGGPQEGGGGRRQHLSSSYYSPYGRTGDQAFFVQGKIKRRRGRVRKQNEMASVRGNKRENGIFVHFKK